MLAPFHPIGVCLFNMTQLELFDNPRPDIVDIQTVKSYGFDDFKDKGYILNEKYSDVLSDYLELYKKINGKPFYNLSLSYNTIMNDKHYKYLLVKIDDDVVFAVYKVIQIVKTKQIRVIGFPVSKNQNTKHQELLTSVFESFDFTKLVTSKKQSGNIRLIEYDDYYINLEKRKELYETSRFRSKYYINKIEKSDKVKVTYSSLIDKKDAIEIRKAWVRGMALRGSIVSSENSRKFYRLISSSHQNLRFLGIYCGGILISLQVFLLSIGNEYCDCLYIHHLWSDYEQYDETTVMILKNITKIQNYFAYEFLNKQEGVKTVYLAGCRPSERRLLAHKNNICDGKIEYYIN